MNVCSSADTTLCIDDFKYRFTDQPNGWFGATVKVGARAVSFIFGIF